MLGQRRERLLVDVVAGINRTAVAVDGLVAAPEDPIVVGQSVIVEPVAGVADPLPVPPADLIELLTRERLADQHVVVDRDDVAAELPAQRRKRVGGEQDPGRTDLSPPVVASRSGPSPGLGRDPTRVPS